jgi:hypothetical protein
MKHELQNIISGKSQVRYGDAIQAIASYLRRGKSTSITFESSKQNKIEEAKNIRQFCDQNNFWNANIDINSFVSSGAEQKVYLHQDEFTVFYITEQFY